MQETAGGVRAVCADGTTFSGTALVAADGLWSRLRKLVHDDGDPIPAWYVAYRGAIPVAELWRDPIRGGELFNQVAVFRSDRFRADSDEWGLPDERTAPVRDL